VSTQGQVYTGYLREDVFIATKKYMGGRPVYHLDMCISQLTTGVDAPPVGVPQDDNRIVDETRGKAFRDYVHERKEWASPSLLLWCPLEILKFTPLTEVNEKVNDPSVILGTLAIPRNSRQSIRILDGQHRILGFHMWMERLNKDLSAAKAHLANAQKMGQKAVIDQAKERLEEAEANLERSVNESVGIDILVCTSAQEAKQIFADIANNAKGMVKALAIGFDQSKIVNRVTTILALEKPHIMLRDRVDFNKDRVSGVSPYFISAKTLSDIVTAVMAGTNGKIKKAQDNSSNDLNFEVKTREFLDAVSIAFEEDLKKTVQDLRSSSLLGSGTVFRVLAGVWFELTKNTDLSGKPVAPKMNKKEATDFFKKLAPFMEIPIKIGSGWLTTGVFPDPSKANAVTAPGSRTQELKTLTDELVNWALKPTDFPFK
jgi:DGQHR domain-containing protein